MNEDKGKDSNKWIYILLATAVILITTITVMILRSPTGCESLEPQDAAFKDQEIYNILHGLYPDENILAFDAYYGDYTGRGYCVGYDSTCQKDKGIWIFNMDELPNDLQLNCGDYYKGVRYKVHGTKDTALDPNGFYFNEDKDIFIIFSAQANEDIIHQYINRFYECA